MSRPICATCFCFLLEVDDDDDDAPAMIGTYPLRVLHVDPWCFLFFSCLLFPALSAVGWWDSKKKKKLCGFSSSANRVEVEDNIRRRRQEAEGKNEGHIKMGAHTDSVRVVLSERAPEPAFLPLICCRGDSSSTIGVCACACERRTFARRCIKLIGVY